MSLMKLLRRFWLCRPFNENQIADAETENVIRDHHLAVTKAESSNEGIRQSQVRLLESIRSVRITSETAERPYDPIAQFVSDMRSSHHDTRRN